MPCKDQGSGNAEVHRRTHRHCEGSFPQHTYAGLVRTSSSPALKTQIRILTQLNTAVTDIVGLQLSESGVISGDS
jgi:hypothetical protein